MDNIKSQKQKNPKKPVVLIIDDDKWFSRVLSKTISSWGFNILNAYDGVDGLVMAIEKRPDIIFVDILMPDINGDIILSILKKLFATSQIPVIVMSGNLSREIIGGAYKSGADGFIAKPFSLKVLYDKMEMCLSPTVFCEITSTKEEISNNVIGTKPFYHVSL